MKNVLADLGFSILLSQSGQSHIKQINDQFVLLLQQIGSDEMQLTDIDYENVDYTNLVTEKTRHVSMIITNHELEDLGLASDFTVESFEELKSKIALT